MSAAGLYDITIRSLRLAKIHIPPGKKHGLHALRHYVERWIMGSEVLKARQHKVFSFNHSP